MPAPPTWDKIKVSPQWNSDDFTRSDQNAMRLHYLTDVLIPLAKRTGRDPVKIQNNFLRATASDMKPERIKGTSVDVKQESIEPSVGESAVNKLRELFVDYKSDMEANKRARDAHFQELRESAGLIPQSLTPERLIELTESSRTEDVTNPSQFINNLVHGMSIVAMSTPAFFSSVLIDPTGTAKELAKWGVEATSTTFDALNYLAITYAGSAEDAKASSPKGWKRMEDAWGRVKVRPEEPLMLFLGAKGAIKGGGLVGKKLVNKMSKGGFSERLKDIGAERIDNRGFVSPEDQPFPGERGVSMIDKKQFKTSDIKPTTPNDTQRLAFAEGKEIKLSLLPEEKLLGEGKTGVPVERQLGEGLGEGIVERQRELGRGADAELFLRELDRVEHEWLEVRDATGDSRFVEEGLEIVGKHRTRTIEGNLTFDLPAIRRPSDPLPQPPQGKRPSHGKIVVLDKPPATPADLQLANQALNKGKEPSIYRHGETIIYRDPNAEVNPIELGKAFKDRPLPKVERQPYISKNLVEVPEITNAQIDAMSVKDLRIHAKQRGINIRLNKAPLAKKLKERIQIIEIAKRDAGVTIREPSLRERNPLVAEKDLGTLTLKELRVQAKIHNIPTSQPKKVLIRKLKEKLKPIDFLKSDEGAIRLPSAKEIKAKLDKIDRNVLFAMRGTEPLKEPYSEGTIRRSAERQGLNPDAVYGELIRDKRTLTKIINATLDSPEATATWDRWLDRKIQPFTRGIHKSMLDFRDKLPPRVARQLSKRYGTFEDIRLGVDAVDAKTRAKKLVGFDIARSVEIDYKNPEQKSAVDRVMRGEPQDLSDPVLKNIDATEKLRWRNLSKQLTNEMKALGQPTNPLWDAADKHYYPAIYSQFETSTIAGMPKKHHGGAKLTKAEKNVGKPSITRSYTVHDSKGVVKYNVSGKNRKGEQITQQRLAAFKTRAEADAFQSERSGHKVRYRVKGERKVIEETFDSQKERATFIKEMGSDISVVEAPKAKNMYVADPMTIEEMVGIGLIEDAPLNIARATRIQTGLIGKLQIYEVVAKSKHGLARTDGVLDKAPSRDYSRKYEDWMPDGLPEHMVRNNKHLQDLKDGYIHDSVGRDMQAQFSENGLNAKLFWMAENHLRGWVTYRYPFRYFKQIPENEMFLYMADTKAFMDRQGQIEHFVESYQGFFKRNPTKGWNEFVEEGITETTFLEELIPRETLSAFDEASAIEHPVMPMSLTSKAGLYLEQNPVAKNVMKFDKMLQSVYQFEDLAYKYHLFQSLRKRGISQKEAGRIVRGTFPDFLDKPEIVNTLKFIPFVPSLTYQFARTYGFMLREKPATTTAKIGVAVMANNLLKQSIMDMRGMTEDENRRAGRLGIKWHQIPLPMSDRKGNDMVLDQRGIIPLFEVMNIPFHDEVEPIKTNVARLSPMVAKPFLSVLNIGAFGQPIYDDNDPASVQAMKIGKSIQMGLRPGMLGHYWARMVANDARGEENKKSLFQIAIAEPMLGRIDNYTMSKRIRIESSIQISELISINTKRAKIESKRKKGLISEKKAAELQALEKRKLDILQKRHEATMLSGYGEKLKETE